MRVKGATVFLKECRFSGSSATAIESSGSSNITLIDSVWSNNRVETPKSLLDLSEGDVKIVNCSFFGNVLSNSLVDCLLVNSLEIDSCSFANNEATRQIIDFNGDFVSVRNSTFTNCSSDGQMIETEALSSTFENSSFRNCTTNTRSGSLVSASSGPLFLATNASFSGVSFINCKAGAVAALLYISNSQGVFSNCKWEGNTGALLAFSPSFNSDESNLNLFTFTDCLISGNFHQNDSNENSLSLISITMGTGEFSALNNLLTNNSGTLFALSLMNTQTALYASAMIENWNVQSGVGGISVQSGWSRATLSKSSFQKLIGPALSLEGSSAEMLDVVMEDISVVGLLHLESFPLMKLASTSSLMIESCLFANIVSVNSFILSESSNLTISNTLFSGIGDSFSASCITASDGDLSIKASNFTSNIASKASGIFTTNMNSISLEDVVANKNVAGTVGFARLQSRDITIRRSSFSGCSVIEGSGALVIDGDAILEDVVFSENLSAEGPGALEIQNGQARFLFQVNKKCCPGIVRISNNDKRFVKLFA